MIDFILRYWIQELFALIIATITWIVKMIFRKKTEYDVFRQGIMALLHDRLYQSCSYYIKCGYCSVEAKHNIEYLYKPYKALGGNGTGEALYKKCMELPIEPPDDQSE